MAWPSSSWGLTYVTPISRSPPETSSIRRGRRSTRSGGIQSSNCSLDGRKTSCSATDEKDGADGFRSSGGSRWDRGRRRRGFIVEGGDLREKRRRRSSRVGSRYFERRPLWDRIFFASKKVRSIILLNVLTVIYASDIPVIKEVEVIMDPAVFTFVRFAIAAIPFLPFLLRAGRDVRTCSAGIELGVWVSLGYIAQTLGLLTSEAGHASFISAITIIVVPFIDSMLGATVRVLTWCGAFVCLVGVAMLELSGSSASVGDILNVLSAVCFGVHMLRTEQISRSTEKEKFLALLSYEVWVVAFVSAIWLFFKSIFYDDTLLSLESWTWSTFWDWVITFPWIPALYTGLFSTGLCLWAEMSAMCDVSATETSIIYGLEPVWGAAFAWFLLGERWGTLEWIGAALVLCGSLTVQILGSAPEKSSKDDHHHSSAPNKRTDLSLSTVVINSRKNAADLFIEKDKL